MNILFPTDFSKNSEVAFQYAIDLANRLSGKIRLVHIYQVPTMEHIAYGSIDNFSNGPVDMEQPTAEKKLLELNEAKLKVFVSKFTELNHQDYSLRAIEGKVKTEIDRILKEEKFDAVVMGFRNEQSQRDVFFGGIAHHLIESAPCPVIAVPPNAVYKDFKKIIYPTDLVHNERNSLTWLIGLARPHDARIHLLHVGDDYEEYRETLAQELCESLPYDHLNFEVVPGVEIARVILEMINKSGADMIGMTTHTTSLFKKLFHASFSKDVLESVNIPFIGFSENTKFELN